MKKLFIILSVIVLLASREKNKDDATFW